MPDSLGKRYFCIHGHFYQPPRENPLFEQIELQPSAHPYHDWNERVFSECYGPNSASRVLDDRGRILDMVNNYAYMSFNIGPTLFSWLEEKQPEAYARILEADRLSMDRLEGHGNAMAQVYNHVIMPLADEDSKALQIKWGIADFKRRFGRAPEGMWLAETAVNMDTVCALIREGVKFTVLAPTQAKRVRELRGDAWTDVSNNDIDPRRPYRIFPVDAYGAPLEKGWLDVFFYDGPLSHGVGFEHLLTDSGRFGEKILGAFGAGDPGDQLVSICTDGESYGHHEAFGDMCAAYLFKKKAPELGLIPVNYAWYLSKHPPEHEVKLKDAHGEGTSWSCSHGVGRWKRDCGCSNGGEAGWNQHWRAPLRMAMERLSEGARKATERWGRELFRDWKRARETATEAWQPDSAARAAWWREQLPPGADKAKAAIVIENLRYTQYIFTSCAWFFADITGIEAQQNLKYAMRVLQLTQSLDPENELRPAFLSALADAGSNAGGERGDSVFTALEHGTPPLHASLALGRWAADFSGEPFAYAESAVWKHVGSANASSGPWTVRENRFAHELSGETMAVWLAFHGDGFDSEGFFFHRPEPGQTLTTGRPLETGSPEPPFPVARLFLPVKSLPPDIKHKMALHLSRSFWAESEHEIRAQEKRLEQKRRQFQRLDWPLSPGLLQFRHMLDNFNLVKALLAGLKFGDGGEIHAALRLASELRAEGVKPHLGPAKRVLRERLLETGRETLHRPGKKDLRPVFALLDLMDVLELHSERHQIENLAFQVLKDLNSPSPGGDPAVKINPEDAILFLDRLNFNTETIQARFGRKSGPEHGKAAVP